MNQQRWKGERLIKSLAKRSKALSYSLTLAISFLMLGNNAFSAENILSKEEIQNAALSLEGKIETLRREEDKNLSSLQLRYIQLMEQGDQVVKSPWASWQFGLNYSKDFSSHGYRGRGDKAEKYTHNAPFERSNNIFERNILPTSQKYSYSSVSRKESALSSERKEHFLNQYGLSTLKHRYENIATLDFGASVTLKDPPTFKEIASPSVNIQLPEIPKQFEILDPILPSFPSYSIVLKGISGRFRIQGNITDEPFIFDENGNVVTTNPPGTPLNRQVTSMGAQNIDALAGQRGNISIVQEGASSFQLNTENVSFQGVANDGTVVSKYDNQLHGEYPASTVFYYSNARDFSIKNTDIHVTGMSNYDVDSVFTLVNGVNSPTSLTIEEDSNILVDAKSSTLIRAGQTVNGNNTHFINKGNITFSKETEGNAILVNFNQNNSGLVENIFENSNTLELDGKKNLGFLPLYGNLKVINNGVFKVKGSFNKVFYHGSGNPNKVSLAFHKPLEIYDSDNIGLAFTGSKSLFDPDSIVKINLYGSNNAGIVPQYRALSPLEFRNISLKSIDGFKNMPFYYYGGLVKLSGGEISIEGGKENIALYGASAPTTIADRVIDSSANIVVKNSPNSYGAYFYNSTGLKNSGDITVEGKGVKGLAFSNPNASAPSVNTGHLSIHGETNTEDGTPAFGIINIANQFSSTGQSDIVVSGEKSTGVYVVNAKGKAEYPNSTVSLANANIKAEEGAINLFVASVPQITSPVDTKILLEDNVNLYTGAKSYSFIHRGEGKTIFNKATTLHLYGRDNIQERGTAFLYEGTARSEWNAANFGLWKQKYFQNTLANLNIQAQQGGRVFQANDISLKLSKSTAAEIQAMGGPSIQGTDYKTFLLHNSNLTLDQAIHLDNPQDDYNRLEVVDSYVSNENKIVGTLPNQTLAINKNDVTGEISLSGDRSVGIYTINHDVENFGKISVQKNSVAMYAENGNAKNHSSGDINIGEASVGIYASLDSGGPYVLENEGKISSTASEAVGMFAEGSQTSSLVNTGTISLEGVKAKGMLLKGNAASTFENKGEIKLGSSTSEEKAVAIFSSSEQGIIINSGEIETGDYGVGIYGYESSLAPNASIKMGDESVGIYSKGKDVSLAANSSLQVGNKSTAIFLTGDAQNLTNDASVFTIGEASYGISNVVTNTSSRTGNTILSNSPNVALKDNSVFLYSNDEKGKIENHSNLVSQGDRVYGIYSAGEVKNYGNMDFSSSLASLAILSTHGGRASNYGNIKVGKSDISNLEYSIGMASDAKQGGGTVVNEGRIDVNGEYSSGMYGRGSEALVINNGEIHLNENNTIGIYLSENAKGINNGLITNSNSSSRNLNGVILKSGASLHNTASGKIILNGVNAIGATLRGGTIRNEGEITVNGVNAEEISNPSNTGKKVDSIDIIAPAGAKEAVIKVKDQVVIPEVQRVQNVEAPKVVQADAIGMYVDTSGVTYTKPIENLGFLTERADLIIGNEAAKYTDSKYIKIEDPAILKPYNDSILRNPQVTKWDIYSASLTWIATATLDSSQQQIGKLYLAKRPYTDFYTEEYANSYHFLDGLEQRYGVEKAGSREHKVFEKLNGIGNNEFILFSQAVDEMMGHQYANVQQRIHETGKILDKEFSYLQKEWSNVSKDSNKVKAFGLDGEYKTSTAGVIDYKNYAQGLAYVHEDETVKLGVSSGWYTGFVRNEFRLQDIGRSKEEMYQGKLGYFRNYAFDDNETLKWHIAGEGFLGHSKLRRRYLVVDEIFGAKSKFWSYGLGLKNEVSKEFRLSEDFKLRPYAMLDLEYGRFQKIRERSGEIRLEVKANDYYSIRPEVGVELAHKFAFGKRNLLKTSIGVAYENELGKVGEVNNKARVAYTTADYFKLRGEKEDRRGNFKADLNLGLENTSYGITANIGYDTNTSKLRGGLGIRVIF